MDENTFNTATKTHLYIIIKSNQDLAKFFFFFLITIFRFPIVSTG